MEGTGVVDGLLVIGRRGQLARALCTLRPEATFLSHDDLDLSKPETVASTLASYQPYAVINAAAYTNVDEAETNEALATRINAESPAAMAAFCADRDIPFVSFSSDYVFDGSGNAPWEETDTPAPLNAYGRSKRAQEEAILSSKGQYLLFRTSWLYDTEGSNFFRAILRLAGEKDQLRVIADQFGAPTYVPHLAHAVLDALATAQHSREFPSGLYHLCHTGETSWHGFASAILAEAKQRGLSLRTQAIQAIPATEYPLPAARPKNSRLDCTRAHGILGVRLPDWREGVQACMQRFVTQEAA